MPQPRNRRPTRYEIELIERLRIVEAQLADVTARYERHTIHVNQSFAQLGGEKGALEVEIKALKHDANIKLTAERDLYRRLYEELLAKVITPTPP